MPTLGRFFDPLRSLRMTGAGNAAVMDMFTLVLSAPAFWGRCDAMASQRPSVAPSAWSLVD